MKRSSSEFNQKSTEKRNKIPQTKNIFIPPIWRYYTYKIQAKDTHKGTHSITQLKPSNHIEKELLELFQKRYFYLFEWRYMFYFPFFCSITCTTRFPLPACLCVCLSLCYCGVCVCVLLSFIDLLSYYLGLRKGIGIYICVYNRICIFHSLRFYIFPLIIQCWFVFSSFADILVSILNNRLSIIDLGRFSFLVFLYIGGTSGICV